MRKMHLRRIKALDFHLMADSLTVGAPISEHRTTRHPGSKKRKKRKKKR